MRKVITVITASIIACSLLTGSASAFNDLAQEQKEPIMALKGSGVVSGMDAEHFVPMGKITYAQTISMLVKGFDLNIDRFRFVKKPEASDYFTTIPNDAWFAQAFVIASLNGLPIPKEVDPYGPVTREQFADLLIHAIDVMGTFPVVKMQVIFADADQMDPQLNYSVQRMILHGIAKLGEDRRFYPKKEMARGEAAVWLYQALAFVKSQTEKEIPKEEVVLSVEKVNSEVNRIILSRGQKPTSGYGIEITGIRFENGGRAVIEYMLTDPLPGSMNASVITEPRAETYISAKYTAVAEPAAASGGHQRN